MSQVKKSTCMYTFPFLNKNITFNTTALNFITIIIPYAMTEKMYQMKIVYFRVENINLQKKKGSY